MTYCCFEKCWLFLGAKPPILVVTYKYACKYGFWNDLPEVDDVEAGEDTRRAEVATGSVAVSGLLLGIQRDWIKSATAVANCCTVEDDSVGNDGEETATGGVLEVGAVASGDEEVGTGTEGTESEASSLCIFPGITELELNNNS